MINRLIENSVKNIPDFGDKRRSRLLSIMLLGVAAIAIFSTATVFILETFNILDESPNVYIATTSLFIGTIVIFFINIQSFIISILNIWVNFRRVNSKISNRKNESESVYKNQKLFYFLRFNVSYNPK